MGSDRSSSFNGAIASESWVKTAVTFSQSSLTSLGADDVTSFISADKSVIVWIDPFMSLASSPVRRLSKSPSFFTLAQYEPPDEPEPPSALLDELPPHPTSATAQTSVATRAVFRDELRFMLVSVGRELIDLKGNQAIRSQQLSRAKCEDMSMVKAPTPPNTAPPRTPVRKSPRTSPKTANHDGGITPELRSFMVSKWATPKDRAIKPSDVARFASDRRDQLSAAYPGEVLIVTSGRLKVRSNDTHYAYRANSAYAWLTGHLEEGGVLLMTPMRTGHRTTLFVRPASGRKTIDFYRDRDYGELWVGPRPGVAETSARLGITCAALETLPKAIDKVRASAKAVRATLGHDPDVDRLLKGLTASKRNAQFDSTLSELRLIKDKWEVAELQRAVDATKVGFDDVLAEFGHATSERWLEGTFFRRARTEGNDVGYGSIVACGHHACTLHWTDNDGPVRDGDLALLDMGVEGLNLYTADVTRTVPINGRFSPLQLQVYEAVLDAQEAGIAACRDGETFLAPHSAAMEVLVSHLVKWGLLKGDTDQLLKTATHMRYTLHGTSHMLGIDVHDCAKARNEFYRAGSLRNGMVLTVEPGLYFQHNDLSVPKEFRGIGVRIEDDVLITAKGPRVLSAAIPKNPSDVEQWVQSSRRSR